MAARKLKRSRTSARTSKVPRGRRRFRVLFAPQVGRAWGIRTDESIAGKTVAAVLAPLLKNPKLTGVSVTVQELIA